MATSLISKPQVLCLDEPSNGLDIYYVEELVEILAQYRKNTQKSLLVSSHDLDFLNKIADKFIVINKGEYQGTLQKDKLSGGELELAYRNLLEEDHE